MILPIYNRGESESGYIQRCRASREMRGLPLDSSYKTKLCKQQVDHARLYLR